MADKKVSQLVGLSGRDIDPFYDMLHIVDASIPQSKHTTLSQLLVGMDNLTNVNNNTVDPDTDKVLLFDKSNGTVITVTVADLVDRLRTEKLTYSTGWDPITTSNGWSKNGNGASKSFTHGLNTTDFQITVMGATNSSGAGATVIAGEQLILLDRIRAKKRYGALVHNVNTSTLTVQLGKDGYVIGMDDGETVSSRNFSWIKIVCRK